MKKIKLFFTAFAYLVLIVLGAPFIFIRGLVKK